LCRIVCDHAYPVLAGLESALGRLRELEREQQQLEARVNLLQEENLELSTEVRMKAGRGAVCVCVCHRLLHAF
jgi:hypothetical protein